MGPDVMFIFFVLLLLLIYIYIYFFFGGGGGEEGGFVGAKWGVEGQIFILIPKLVVPERIDNKNCSELFYPLIFYL